MVLVFFYIQFFWIAMIGVFTLIAFNSDEKKWKIIGAILMILSSIGFLVNAGLLIYFAAK